jgi:hypothetical protein
MAIFQQRLSTQVEAALAEITRRLAQRANERGGGEAP